MGEKYLFVVDSDGNASDGYLLESLDPSPTISEVTPVPNPTTDNTPDYTFHTTGTGTIIFGGDCASLTTTVEAGNNTITFTELSDGTYDNCTITLTDGSGNVSDPLGISDFVVDTQTGLTANFIATDTGGVAIFGTHFIDSSSGQPTSWQWDFDNDGIVDSTEQNPYYAYMEAGNYNVRLVVSDAISTDQEIKLNYITVTENTTITSGSGTAVTASSNYRGMGGGQNDQRHGSYEVNNVNAGFFGAPYINPVNVKASIIKVPTLCGVPESNYVTHNLYNLIRRTTGLPVQCASELTLVPQSLQLGQRDICNE